MLVLKIVQILIIAQTDYLSMFECVISMTFVYPVILVYFTANHKIHMSDQHSAMAEQVIPWSDKGQAEAKMLFSLLHLLHLCLSPV